jgi:hypothetical protein
LYPASHSFIQDRAPATTHASREVLHKFFFWCIFITLNGNLTTSLWIWHLILINMENEAQRQDINPQIQDGSDLISLTSNTEILHDSWNTGPRTSKVPPSAAGMQDGVGGTTSHTTQVSGGCLLKHLHI